LFVKDNDLTFERKFELLREIYEYGKRYKLGIAVIAVGLGVLKKRIDKLGGYLQSRLTYSPEMVLSRDELIKIGQMSGIEGEIGVGVVGIVGTIGLIGTIGPISPIGLISLIATATQRE